MNIYKVKKGDTLRSVAQVFKVTQSELARINNVREIREGERIIVLPPAVKTHRVMVGESVDSISAKYGFMGDELLSLNMCESIFPGMKLVIERG